MSKTTDVKQPVPDATLPRAKREYTRPALREIGKVKDLTAGFSGTMADGMSMKMF